MNTNDDFLTSFPMNNQDCLLGLINLFQGQFSIDWIVSLTNSKPSKALCMLTELTKAGWLKQKQNGFYCLSNTKRQKGIKSLSSNEQIKFNRCIAKILMEDGSEDHSKAKVISYYLRKIHNDLNGCRWLKKAGDIFLNSFEVEEASQCYLKIIDDLSCHCDEEAQVLFIETALRYAKISMGKKKTSDTLSIYRTALDMATKLDIPSYCALLKMNIANNEWLLLMDDNAIKHFQESRMIAEKLENHYVLDQIDKYSVYFYYWQGLFREAIKCYESFAPEITTFPHDRSGLICMHLAGLCYAKRGQVSQGLGMLDSVKRHSEEIRDYYMEAFDEGNIGLIMLDIARNDDALYHLERGMELAVREGNVWMAITCNLGLAICYHLICKSQKSVACIESFVDLSTKVQVKLRDQPYLMMICWIIEQKGLPPLHDLSLKVEINKALSSKNVFMKGIAYKYQALLDRGKKANNEDIMKSLNLSFELLQQSGSEIEAAKTQLEIIRQHLLAGNEELAQSIATSVSKILLPLNEALIPDDLKSICNTNNNLDKFLSQVILQLGQEIVNSRTNKELTMKLISSVNRITGAERGAVFFNSKDGLELHASINFTQEQFLSPAFAASMSVIKEVAETGIGVIKELCCEGGVIPSEKESIRSVVCAPMKLRDKVKGSIYHDNRLISHLFNESDLQWIEYFASLAAIAFENITAYETLQDTNKKITEEKEYFEEQYLNRINRGNIIGESKQIKLVLKQIEKVAPTDTTILILGDTGVGKELVAHAIHNNSNRKNRPLICVQCSALPEKLISSELFGHEKGSFTGALSRRVGRFELADHGTVFIDEIGELQPDLQVQLLRVLQTKQFERIGSNEVIQSDFRLIAATNRNLSEEVKAGRFRMDLYYRLNVFPIHVPALKDRKSDIPLFVDYFTKLYSKKLGKVFNGVTQDDMKMLLKYDWPGNVRELEHIVERAVILSREPILHFSGLSPSFSHIPLVEGNDIITLNDNERNHIIQTLQKTNWKVGGSRGAAKLLDINPSTLIFRMKKLGIKRPP